jgi:hypothetical protein
MAVKGILTTGMGSPPLAPNPGTNFKALVANQIALYRVEIRCSLFIINHDVLSQGPFHHTNLSGAFLHTLDSVMPLSSQVFPMPPSGTVCGRL